MTMVPSRKVFIKTYGCQMNVYDSERMADVLVPLGYAQCASPEAADLVILNTCHIREKAAEKVYSELGRLRPLKSKRAAQGAVMTIAVAGCVAQAEGEEMVARAPVVDLVFGPQTYHRLPELLARHRAGQTHVVETEFPAQDKFDRLEQAVTTKRSVSAFLTVQEGCDKFCTFCVVPYTRGVEFSRPVERIAAEAEKMALRGVREITLLGQNVNAYHGAGPDGEACNLARLLDRLSQIQGLDRLRYTTSHPRDVDDDLIAAHGENPKLMPYLHLPVQSGSDRVLHAMNRRHSAEDYLTIVNSLRAARPDLALSSDFIVGFPGETDLDFEATLSLVRQVRFAQAYSFKYSPRPGTPAAEFESQVPEAEKSDRLARLQAVLSAQQVEFNSACRGRQLGVLLEKPGRHPGQLVGRSPYLQAVHVDAGPERIGELVEARIETVGANSLSAHIMAAA